ncbi:MAG: hypothetical protein ACI89X_001203 [Planctomycetota bacterium]
MSTGDSGGKLLRWIRGSPNPLLKLSHTCSHRNRMLVLRTRSVVTWIIAAAVTVAGALGQSTQQEARLEFFENRIRPVLVDSCYSCHSTNGKQKGEVALDHRDGMRTVASEGPIVVPGKPEQSVLLKVLRHQLHGLEMPKDGARMSDAVIADFKQWIQDGAVDPRHEPPSKDDLEVANSWPAKLALRRKWWSLQAIVAPAPPPDDGWSQHPVDRYIAAAQRERSLQRAEQATNRTLLRRLSYALTGLPPTADELHWFEQDGRADAYERTVDRLLASPRFGEHWARHWMDVVRYADSHGSEGDPAIPYAYQYRDYLIRAFNQDVPYDQLVREHIAGDLLEQPRIDATLGVNESTLGTAHWRFVFHGYLPTEPLQEKVRFVDDQINVLGKAFLGQTISCARCHDHKFDAISQADYYALFGVLASCRPGIHDANTKELQVKNAADLRDLKGALRKRLAIAWRAHAAANLAKQLAGREHQTRDDAEHGHPAGLLHEVDRRVAAGATFSDALRDVLQAGNALPGASTTGVVSLDPTRDSDWFRNGNGLQGPPARPGAFAINLTGDAVVRAIYPSGAYTHLISTRHRGVLHSRRFDIGEGQVAWALVMGKHAQLRCVVQDYPRSGLTYSRTNLNHDTWQWQRIDLSYWRGDRAHLELTTSRDAPIEVGGDERSFFGLREVRLQPKGAPKPTSPPNPFGMLAALRAAPPQNRAALIKHLRQRMEAAIDRWAASSCSDEDALLLEACLRHDLLPNKSAHISGTTEMLARYRALEAAVATPTRIPGLLEGDAADHPLFERGDPNQPREIIPRRFLEVLGGTRYQGIQSGRRALAEDLARPDNPLTARVMVNRIWHHLFGQGLVATPDNFGKLGAVPSHPELLDHLAARFMANGWSIKDTMRYLVTSKTWRLAAHAPDTSATGDPDGIWLTHARTRRLTAEALRDSLFATAGVLKHEMYGSAFSANTNIPRRSVYMRSRRNDMDTFLTAFDAPTPFAPVGARHGTNVPAQSLAMLNSPLVWELAESWSKATADTRDDTARLKQMFESATARPPKKEEVNAILRYMQVVTDAFAAQRTARAKAAAALATARSARAVILDPVRAKLVAGRDSQSRGHGPAPIAGWDFRQGPNDQIGELDGELHGSARLDANGLVLDGLGWFATEALQRDLTAKTLEAWVRLDDLEQRGGGVVTLQDLGGGVFDAIVYGERQRTRWIAGSDHFRRTQDVDGTAEAAATTTAPVHLAITYSTDGTVTIYRAGLAYGKSYRTQIANFRAGNAQLLVGLRHGHEADGRALRGHVLEARLYDRALTAAEVSASANGMPFVSDQQLLAALSEHARHQVTAIEKAIEAAQHELAAHDEAAMDKDPWTLAAHAIFNLKEFQYLR